VSPTANGRRLDFWVDDDAYREARTGSFATCADAIALLERLALIPWGEAPNLPPCTTGPRCECEWMIYERVRGDSIRHGPSLVVDERGARWVEGKR